MKHGGLPAYGIDLGTTNSLIARFVDGRVEVLRNPHGFREVLPSVVAFRKGRTVVGDGAVTLLQKGHGSVCGGFKRRMGTAEVYTLEGGGQTVSPVELSAAVLRELRAIAEETTGDYINDVVITVPAAFDILQSEATRQAGRLAGFGRVDLLQEPIAACLAYANRTSLRRKDGDQWLVYDLGGGTLDIALVRIDGGEMHVVDHEGDNFFGGRDFDNQLVMQLLAPALAEMTTADGLSGMHCAGSPHHALYRRLLGLAEQAKAELSAREETAVEIESQVGGQNIEMEVRIRRPQFEELIAPSIDRTVRMIEGLLGRNRLQPTGVQFILFVGGATYTPLVRNRIHERLGIAMASDIDPTNAIAVGAAYYAGSLRRTPESLPSERKGGDRQALDVAFSYAKASKASHEMLAVRTAVPPLGASYRITRQDGAYDTGFKPLVAKIYEDLPLAENVLNVFTFAVYDTGGKPLDLDASAIRIAHGTYLVQGQPLAHDICLEVDDLLACATRLEAVFPKNTVLPARRTVTRILSKTVAKDSDDCVSISLYEGDCESRPAANLCIGQIRIAGRDLSEYLVQGTSVELTFEMSGSRELAVTARIPSCQREFSRVFAPENRHVDLAGLLRDIEDLERELEILFAEECRRGRSQTLDEIEAMRNQAETLSEEGRKLRDDDTTDAKFQLDDRCRRLFRQAGQISMNRELATARFDYGEVKQAILELVGSHGTDDERRRLGALLGTHEAILHGRNPVRIKGATAELHRFGSPICVRQPEYPLNLFHHLQRQQSRYVDSGKAEQLLRDGRVALECRDDARLMDINARLLDLLPPDEKVRLDKIRLIGIA